MREPQVRVYGHRWVNLAIFGLLGFAMGFSVMGPTAIVGEVAEEWSVGFSDANLALVVLGGVFGSLLGLPAGRACDKIGYKPPLVVGATIASVGLLLRATASSWGLFLIDNAIVALGTSTTMSGIGTMIRNWFPMQEIGHANGLSMFLWPLGGAAGMYAVFPLIESVGWTRMWLIMGLVYAVATALSWVLLKEKPELPPSRHSASSTSSGGFIHDLKQVMNRTNIVLRVVSLALAGLMALSPALLPVVLESRNMPSSTIGMVMALFNLIGVPAMATIPGWAFRTGRPERVMTASMFLAAFAFIAAFYAPISWDGTHPLATVWLAVVLTLAIGIAFAAIGPISMTIGMLQPGVTPQNVGVLSGVASSVMGLGRLVIPYIAGELVDRFGATAGAWAVTVPALLAGAISALLISTPRSRSIEGHQDC